MDAFDLLLDPTTEMHGSTKFNVNLSDMHMKHVIPALAEMATVFIQLKNYYKKQNGVIAPLVGQQTTQPPTQPSRNQQCSCRSGLKWKHCHGKGNSGHPPSHPAKPSPETVLLLDPFMQQIKHMGNGHSNGNGTHASPKLHLRSGGWRNYTMQNPLGGAISWQTGKPKKLTMGKNYGRICFAPTDPTKPIGDPSRGVSTKRSRIELGNWKTQIAEEMTMIDFKQANAHRRIVWDDEGVMVEGQDVVEEIARQSSDYGEIVEVVNMPADLRARLRANRVTFDKTGLVGFFGLE